MPPHICVIRVEGYLFQHSLVEKFTAVNRASLVRAEVLEPFKEK